MWLLDASWDRATSGSERLEQSVTKEFDKISQSLSDEERKGRIDIRYRTSAGKHIIIELKRYQATYKFDQFDLAKQVDKYISALGKCLSSIGETNPYIEAICIIGPNALDDISKANEVLKSVRARILTYDQLIEYALNSYKDYLERNKEVGKIRKLIESSNKQHVHTSIYLLFSLIWGNIKKQLSLFPSILHEQTTAKARSKLVG